MERFGDFVLLERLGEGAMGDAHLARTLDGGSASPALVIKRLHPHLSRSDEVVQRFEHEALIASSIDSRHVARVYGAGRVGDQLYLAMEYINGWSLERVLEEHRDEQKTISLRSAFDLVIGLLAGLEAMHDATDEHGDPLGIVHRDVSARNVLLRQDGSAVLIDFGLGRSRRQDWKTSQGVVMGSPGYMSPEHCTASTIDHRSDLYCAGILLYEILAGRRFIERGRVHDMLMRSVAPQWLPPSTFRDDLPPHLDDLLTTALALDPDDRFQTARDFRNALLGIDAPAPRALTLVDDMMKTAIRRRQTQVRELLESQTPPPPDTVEQTVVFVRAPAPRRASRTPAPRVWMPLVAFAALLATVAFLTVDGSVGKELPAPTRAIPDVTPRAVPAPEPPPPVERVETAQRPAPPPPPVRKRRRRRKAAPPPPPPPPPRRAPPATVAEPPPPPPIPTVSRERRVDRMIQEVLALQKRLPSERRPAARRLLADLSRHRASPRFADEADTTRVLAERLRALREAAR